MFTTSVESSHARYKSSIHKDVIKDAFDQNFPMILKHLDTLTSKSKYLTDINAQINQLTMNIKADGNYKPEDSDIFFDGENIIISVQNLGYGGRGTITDMETNVKESITFDSLLEPI
jgi:hypothetical protein